MEDSCAKVKSNDFSFPADFSDTQCCLISERSFEAADISNYSSSDTFFPKKVLAICKCSPSETVARFKKHHLGVGDD